MRRGVAIALTLTICLLIAIFASTYKPMPKPSPTPEDAPFIEISPHHPTIIHGKLVGEHEEYEGDHYYKLKPIKSGWEVRLEVELYPYRNMMFEVAIYTPRHAMLDGVSEVIEVGNRYRYHLYYVFSQSVPDYLLLRVAKSRGILEYWIKIEVITHYDDGIEGDAGSDAETAVYLGELKPNKGFMVRGWIGDQDHDGDVGDYYKMKVEFNGRGNITIHLDQEEKGLICISVLDQELISVGHECARYWGEPVDVVVKYEAENVSQYMYVALSNVKGYDTNYNMSIIQYEEPSPPPPSPIIPPTYPIESLLPFIIAFILLVFWLLNIKPVGPLKDISMAADKIYKKIVEIGRKVIRDENPVSITPRATHAIAKTWIVVFGLTIAQIAFYIKLCGWYPLHLVLWPKMPWLILDDLGRFLGHLWLHVSIAHLVGNLVFFIVWADNVEERIGGLNLLLWILFPLNLGSVLAFTIGQFLIGQLNVLAVGGSGVISGVAGAYYVFYPNANVVIAGRRVKADKFLMAWFIYQLLLAMGSGVGAGVAYSAHVGGFLAGVLMARRYQRLHKAE